MLNLSGAFSCCDLITVLRHGCYPYFIDDELRATMWSNQSWVGLFAVGSRVGLSPSTSMLLRLELCPLKDPS